MQSSSVQGFGGEGVGSPGTFKGWEYGQLLVESAAAVVEAGGRMREAARVAQVSDMAVGWRRYQGRLEK